MAHKDPEKRAEYRREYNRANREKRAEYQREYHQANREKACEYQRRYYQANRERRAECNRRRYEVMAQQIQQQSRNRNAATQKIATHSGLPWTPAEDRVVMLDMPLVEIAADLKRSLKSVQSRRSKLRKRKESR